VQLIPFDKLTSFFTEHLNRVMRVDERSSTL
jgi:hypothetical protein